MSLHKLTAGSGYDYLTRQVAVQDSTEKGRVSLASYYTEKGETPGVWVGSGMVGIDGLDAGDLVTAEQMHSLFALGMHPLAGQRQDTLTGPNLTSTGLAEAARLGTPYKIYSPDVSPFRLEVARRLAAWNTTQGLPAGAPIPLGVRAGVRSEVGREFFRAEFGRDPVDARELAGLIARQSRPQTTAVAGFDLTFSPVKSVSALWALADPSTAAVIERAHNRAVADALALIEREALFTRVGTNGVRQVDVRGLVGTAFTHRDSRAGDPDLHTHVAVANKVQTLDGRWLAIDGRVLFKAKVTASETYNTALERHLADALGVQFVERHTQAGRRPVREVVGVDDALNRRWSARRQSIEARHAELAADFQAVHGRPPTAIESLALAQQANLETRQAKHEPRTLTEQRAAWREQAEEVLGGPDGFQQMIRQALHPAVSANVVADPAWCQATAARIVGVVQADRAVWQSWHVRAEAQRQVRTTSTPPAQLEALVDQLVQLALAEHSTPITPPLDGITEPDLLRRLDGSSMYTVAGAALYTSPAILAAEQRLLAAGARADGRAADTASVDLALLESEANGITLNPGQAHLVRAMATSGRRLQLAIAPAGSGKTTAMHALATAWTNAGGTIIGLAPSAAAAAALGEQLGAHTDTLAKLAWSLDRDDTPAWVRQIGPDTLVVIDEAGMADTLSLDATVAHVLDRGGSVRLIGDDQQLAAIGSGGILRDLAHTHGVLRLTEVVRFTDPAEAAASLALRDGRPEALGFYLDQRRVHVGELGDLTHQVFTAWTRDRDAGLDAIMLAGTRDLVADLNQRARSHRLHGTRPDAEVLLADGNHASVGDTIITRLNDRRLRVSSSDWVKNGDRWTVTGLTADGGLRVRHTASRLAVTLPADYVTGSVELGYACTIHTAQGVSVDTMHGLAGDQLTGQQLYTMLTRGRHANHAYLPVVTDGNPHTALHPDTILPPSPTDLLERILARDEHPTSASTLTRELAEPTLRLGHAAGAYADAVGVAAEHLAPAPLRAALDQSAERLLPGLTTADAWPALRAHLLLHAADGHDPVAALTRAAGAHELGTAHDPAAVLDWRLPTTAEAGPLPWLPAIPARLADHPTWGPYLTARRDLVADLAHAVHQQALTASNLPAWAADGLPPTRDTIAALEVWRAATGVDPADRRPTGARQLAHPYARSQQALERQLAAERSTPLTQWEPLLLQVAPTLVGDGYLPTLAHRLTQLAAVGVDAPALLRDAAAQGPLPDDHPAAALWWRISRHLTPTITAALHDQQPPAPAAELVPNPGDLASDPVDNDPADAGPVDLTVEAMIRDGLPAPEPDTARLLARADAWAASPVPRERLVEVNELAARFFESAYPTSWARPYLSERFHVELAGDPHWRPGYAPDSWTALLTHLRRRGVTDTELLTAGLATTTATGRLIDRFRNRAVLPITHDGNVLGFVGRRHPALTDADKAGPKYLNTPDTPLFHKGDQLYTHPHALDAGAIPVIVEGPLDAIAVTLASRGRYAGAAPLGTSLTDAQAAQLADLGRTPIVATDADHAGQAAAARDHWILTPHHLHPRHANLPDGTDPADLLATGQASVLLDALDGARPLAYSLIDRQFATLAPADAALEALRVVAAQPANHWDADLHQVADRLQLPEDVLKPALRDLIRNWNHNPSSAARDALHHTTGREAGAAPATSGAGWQEPPPSRAEPRRSHPRPLPATPAVAERSIDR